MLDSSGEITPRRPRRADVADFVNGDDVIARIPGEHAGQLYRVLGFDQLVDQGGRGRKPHAPLLPAGRHTQARQEMGLAGAAVADEHDRLGAGDVATVGEVAELTR
ncbi:hypothetical protein BH23BAC4_BH23BAC4_12320 [soil metagenome]